MNTQESNSQVQKTVTAGKLEVTRVYKSPYQKEGTQTAEIKQTVTTVSTYPSKSVRSNLQDNPFANEEFGFEAGQTYESTETRVAWVDVPLEATVETVIAKIATLPEAGIYKIMANRPILSDNQKYGITAGLTTVDAIGDRQAVRYPDNHPQAGQLILDPNGKPQYRAVYFTSNSKEDVDMRTATPADFYSTEAMKADLAGISNTVGAEQETL